MKRSFSEGGQPASKVNKFTNSKWRRPEPKTLNPKTDELSKITFITNKNL